MVLGCLPPFSLFRSLMKFGASRIKRIYCTNFPSKPDSPFYFRPNTEKISFFLFASTAAASELTADRSPLASVVSHYQLQGLFKVPNFVPEVAKEIGFSPSSIRGAYIKKKKLKFRSRNKFHCSYLCINSLSVENRFMSKLLSVGWNYPFPSFLFHSEPNHIQPNTRHAAWHLDI